MLYATKNTFTVWRRVGKPPLLPHDLQKAMRKGPGLQEYNCDIPSLQAYIEGRGPCGWDVKRKICGIVL
jgi:hypothetical protein